MTTNDKNTGTEPQDARRKGGADGKAKRAEAENQPAKTQPDTPPSADPTEPGYRSRKITSGGK